MMRQLNLTVNRLQWAAENVSHGLAPLNYGLEDSEISLLTGRRELTETERVTIKIYSWHLLFKVYCLLG